jgi:hypothetical protein
MRRSSALLAGLLALSIGAAGCGSSDHTTTRTDTTAPVVLSIRTSGGFVPYGADFVATPLLVLADGTVLTGGPVPDIYPGPAVAPVQTGALDTGALRGLLDAARQAGLDHDDLDGGQPGITDVGTTTISVVLDGVRHTNDVYGLFAADADAPGLTPAQRDVRTKVRAFAERAQHDTEAVATSIYEPRAYQVLAAVADPSADVDTLDGTAPKPKELEWPFPDLPLRDHACVDVDEARAPTFAAALRRATQITIWRDAADRPWNLSTRAVLPGDGPCPTEVP